MSWAIIPARGGSQRIPRKNIREFHGKPIIAYSIETAIQSGLFDEIVITTDDLQISDIAFEYGATMLHKRAGTAARDNVGTQEVARRVLNTMEKVGHELPEYTCVIYATAPLMVPEDLIRGYQYLKEKDLNFQYSVGMDPEMHDAGQWYWGKTVAFQNKRPLRSKSRSGVSVIPRERVCDINTEEDWVEAERKYKLMTGAN